MNKSNKSIITILFVLVLVPFVTLGLNNLVSGGARIVSLKAAPALTGQLSQTLGVMKNGKLPIYGKDYKTTVRYFHSKTWVVASIAPLSDEFNGTPIVMQKQSGVYQIVLGPGGAFSSDQLRVLPNDVREYLLNAGVIHDRTP
ncbi:MAG TPA: hypothetical protein VFH99_03485 [Candidatus Saccharimonadales bacterium]|nr:hypothetical protein [Candidatus Saccharimonadales bacterium]